MLRVTLACVHSIVALEHDGRWHVHLHACTHLHMVMCTSAYVCAHLHVGMCIPAYGDVHTFLWWCAHLHMLMCTPAYVCAHLPMVMRGSRVQKTLEVVAHTFNPSTQEAEAGGPPWVRGQPGLQSQFQDSQGYTQRNSVLKPTPKKQEN